MTKKVFLRWALLFLSANYQFSAMNSYIWIKTIREKTMELFGLAQELNIIDDEPDKPP